MSAKNKILWCIWIGMLCGIYTLLYLLSPLAKYNLMWVSFVALPIYFMAGAQRKDYLSFAASNVIGVLWGLVYLWVIRVAIEANFSPDAATTMSVGVVTFVCCTVHLFVPEKGLANKIPAIFGAVASTFSQNGENVVIIAITLLLGCALALGCQEGTTLLKEKKPENPISDNSIPTI